jgi:hypothetical protein
MCGVINTTNSFFVLAVKIQVLSDQVWSGRNIIVYKETITTERVVNAMIARDMRPLVFL